MSNEKRKNSEDVLGNSSVKKMKKIQLSTTAYLKEKVKVHDRSA